jgi:beta-xylosidase
MNKPILIIIFLFSVFLSKTIPLANYNQNPGYHPSGYTLKDYCVVKKGGIWHLFGIKCRDGGSWDTPGNEVTFIHATSVDLVNWETEGDVINTVAGSYENDHVWAPAIIEKGGIYYMFYTMVVGNSPNSQTIGYATSTDLFNWTQHSSNSPLWVPATFSGWASWSPSNGSCRDPFVMWVEELGKYVMYYTSASDNFPAVVGAATSADLINWNDAGYVFSGYSGGNWGTGKLESPYVIKHNSHYYLFYNHGAPAPPSGTGDGIHWVMSDNPLNFGSMGSPDPNPCFVPGRNNIDLFYGESAPWKGGEWLFNVGYDLRIGKIIWQGDIPVPQIVDLKTVATLEFNCNQAIMAR